MVTLQRGGAELLTERLDELVAIYRQAFLEVHEPDPERATRERRTTMPRHRDRAGLDVVVALEGSAAVGFVYSYRGQSGQWWRDVVAGGMTRTDPSGGLVERWLTDSRELVELHVLPRYQGHGIGRALLAATLDQANERTVVLSALDDQVSRTGAARTLYAKRGFVTLLEQFLFPGSRLPYAVLGRDQRAAAATAAPSVAASG